jgi:predicted carbohydrate-binding protein with CBM5 and CBM33 domain
VSRAAKTRRFNYFITKTGWDPQTPLTRAQFDGKPFSQLTSPCRPYWDDQAMRLFDQGGLRLGDGQVTTVSLPDRKGYHVILGVCECADTGTAFYQVLDVDFG